MSETHVERCDLCGEPLPEGERMFRIHGYSGPCPKAPLPELTREDTPDAASAEWPAIRVAKERCPLYHRRLAAIIDAAFLKDPDGWTHARPLVDSLLSVPAEAIAELEAEVLAQKKRIAAAVDQLRALAHEHEGEGDHARRAMATRIHQVLADLSPTAGAG